MPAYIASVRSTSARQLPAVGPLVLGLLLATGTAVPTSAAGYLSDPVVTFTNGMRLPSSTSLRSHNAYWQCDPGHKGYCDGRCYSATRNSLRGLGKRCDGRFRPPYGAPPQPTASLTHHAPDGLERGDSQSLGMLPQDAGMAALGAADGTGVGAGFGTGAPAGVAAPAVAPPTGGVWLDAIQELGRKMAQPGG